jgi:hypothetical protein
MVERQNDDGLGGRWLEILGVSLVSSMCNGCGNFDELNMRARIIQVASISRVDDRDTPPKPTSY